MSDAKALEREWARQKEQGTLASTNQKMTVRDFFEFWFKSHQGEASQSGWRKTQFHYATDYIIPVIGGVALQKVTPAVIERVLTSLLERKLSPKTQSLVYGTLKKVFSDSVGIHRILSFNPVTEELKPKLVTKEARHLNLEEAKRLLEYVRDKPFGTAIWLQLYLGLRVGEVQALTWEDVDLVQGTIAVRKAFVNRTRVVRDYPKGKRQHTLAIPADLHEFLRLKASGTERQDLVTQKSDGKLISYRWYQKTLRKYCIKLGINEIGTHGLRHTASVLYLSFGANKEDLQQLFAHSAMKVTNLYIHNWNSQLGKIAPKMKLFP